MVGLIVCAIAGVVVGVAIVCVINYVVDRQYR